MTLESLYDNLTRLDVAEVLGRVLEGHGDDILEYQRGQLTSGKASDGENIRPLYSEDRWFKSPESAARYASHKHKIDIPTYANTQNRDEDAPVLYITGRFYGELGVRFSKDSVEIVPSGSLAQKVFAKYGSRTFGLSRDNWNLLFTQKNIVSEVRQDILDILYA